MTDGSKFVLGVLAAIVLFIAVIFGICELGYRVDQRYQPLEESVRNNTFHQSAAYNEGMISDLRDIRDQYMSKQDQASKDGIAASFIQKANHYPNQLPPDLQQFLIQIRGY